MRRVVRGDNRVRQPKRTFWSIGLETDVRMAPNGRNATFYRLDASAFMIAFSDWYEHEHKGVTSEGVMTQCIARWGKPVHDAQKALEAAHLRLGEELTAQVLDRCLKAGGNSWRYAETSLSNEAAAAKTVVSCQDNFDVKATDKFEDATPAAVFPPLGNVPRLSVRGHMTPFVPGAPYEPVAPDPSVEETWVGSPAIPARSVAALWDEALLCIKLRDGDAYETHFHDLHLVAFDAETITFTVVTDSHYYDHVQHSARMTRALRCQLRQVMALAPTNTVNI